jgi:hypothetical protein
MAEGILVPPQEKNYLKGYTAKKISRNENFFSPAEDLVFNAQPLPSKNSWLRHC